MKSNNNKQKKLYKIIAKVENEKFVKYNCNNLVSLTKFLDEKYKGWRWFNVYENTTKKQIGNFTNKSRPTKARI